MGKFSAARETRGKGEFGEEYREGFRWINRGHVELFGGRDGLECCTCVGCCVLTPSPLCIGTRLLSPIGVDAPNDS